MNIQVLLEILKVIYQNANMVSLIASYFKEGNYYFIIMMSLIIIEKSIIIQQTYQTRKRKKENDNNIVEITLFAFLNVVNFKRFHIGHIQDFPLKLIPFLSSLIYDLISIYYAFYYGAIFESSFDSVFGKLLCFQIFLGFLYKAVLLELILIYMEDAHVNFRNILQIFSLFLGITCVQGLGLLLVQRISLCLSLVLWKLLVTFSEYLIIRKYDLKFFGVSPQDKLSVALLVSVINFFFLPVDYAPYYDNSRLQNEVIDYKYQQITTQKSLIILKIGQIADLIVMVLMILLNDLLVSQLQVFQAFYRITIVCLIIYIAHQIPHIIYRLYQYRMNNYTYYTSEIESFERFKSIITNSQSPRYLHIPYITQFERLAVNRVDSDQYSEERKEIYDQFFNIQKFSLQYINIYNHSLYKHKDMIQVSADYFIDQILDDIEFQYNLKPITITPGVQVDRKEKYQSALFNRVLAFGVDNNLKHFISIQYETDVKVAQEAINILIVDFSKLIIYKRDIIPYLLMNPNEIYYDLYSVYSD